MSNSNMTSFFRFVNKRVIYRLGIRSLAHAPGIDIYTSAIARCELK